MRPLVIGEAQKAALARLREAAAQAPVDMPALQAVFKAQDQEAMARHRAQMTAQTVALPVGFLVTFSVEHGHPAGVCRHLSVSVDGPGKLPHPAAVEMIAAEMGFAGGLAACVVYPEDLQRRGKALNVVQPIAVAEAGEGRA
jgi:hypothetical protein